MKGMAVGRLISWLADDEVEIVNEFTYLGSCVTSDGDLDKEVRCRIAKTARVFCLSESTHFQKNQLSTGNKRNIHWSWVLYIMEQNLYCEGEASKMPDNFPQSLCLNHHWSIQVSAVDGEHYHRAIRYSLWHGRDIGKHPYVMLLMLVWSLSTHGRSLNTKATALQRDSPDPDMARGKVGV